MALKVVGSSPINYPLVLKKFKKRVLKKKIKKVLQLFVYFLNISILKKVLNIVFVLYKQKHIRDYNNKQSIIILNINQKKFNTKINLFKKKNTNMFSIGSVVKYFNVKQGKSIRRSSQGLKILLNFLKNFLDKKLISDNPKTNCFFLTIRSVDYNLSFLKTFFKKLFLKNFFYGYFFFNTAIAFCKNKNRKKKSIKKRLKKTQLKIFLKNV